MDGCYKLLYNLAHGHATHRLLEHRGPAAEFHGMRQWNRNVLTINIAGVLITSSETVLQERQTLRH